MTGLRAVTRMAFLASQPVAFSALAVMPMRQLSMKEFTALMMTSMLWNRL